MIGTGTFGCGSTIVEGEDFIAENITFENSAPEVQNFLLFYFGPLINFYLQSFDLYVSSYV